MSPTARKLLAKEYFLLGFSASGYGFNGDSLNVDEYPAVKSILEQFFDLRYKE